MSSNIFRFKTKIIDNNIFFKIYKKSIEAISKTQVSLKFPQIGCFSLQCGLAEGDKISNAFTNTLANPDEFITLSLSTLCLYSIEIQLIDSQTRTVAIFMIDKIDTQFCRLFFPSMVKKMTAARLDLSLLNGSTTSQRQIAQHLRKISFDSRAYRTRTFFFFFFSISISLPSLLYIHLFFFC